MTDAPQPEFSYVIDLDGLGGQGKTYRLIASEDQRARIARRLQTPSVEKLEGEMKVTASKSEIRVEGSLSALLTRECVASLELMDEAISEAFDADFARGALAEDEDPDDLEAPEVIEGDSLDLGELLVQQLSIAMDPFPRKPGAKSLAEDYAPKDSVSPFAALKGALGKTDDNQ